MILFDLSILNLRLKQYTFLEKHNHSFSPYLFFPTFLSNFYFYSTLKRQFKIFLLRFQSLIPDLQNII